MIDFIRFLFSICTSSSLCPTMVEAKLEDPMASVVSASSLISLDNIWCGGNKVSDQLIQSQMTSDHPWTSDLAPSISCLSSPTIGDKWCSSRSLVRAFHSTSAPSNRFPQHTNRCVLASLSSNTVAADSDRALSMSLDRWVQFEFGCDREHVDLSAANILQRTTLNYSMRSSLPVSNLSLLAQNKHSAETR